MAASLAVIFRGAVLCARHHAETSAGATAGTFRAAPAQSYTVTRSITFDEPFLGKSVAVP
jgi:hypothetical protein